MTKWLLKGLEDLEVGGWVETIQTTAFLKTVRILRRILETWEDLLSLNLQWKPSAYADVKNSNNNNNNNSKKWAKGKGIYGYAPYFIIEGWHTQTVLLKERRKRLASIEDSVDASIKRLEDYS